mmetsp:Transcript_28146/g.51148  ORF Transcript_28146/g.51148 Transcript_28146/m.51148 type:complete len:588 (-) Transcript_28146:154-1917(-)
MILYKRGGANFFLKLCQCKGSVFPFALAVAFPCSALSIAVKFLVDYEYLPYLAGEDAIMNESTAWRSFSFLVGFLVVFRTSQAYSRFWDGCTFTHQMRAEWFIACSSIIAFCKHSRASTNRIQSFQECIVRLFSMLHAVALAEIEDVNADCAIEEIQAFRYELIDAEAIDPISLETIKESDSKVELVFHWIQQLIVENIESDVLSLPAPILTRCFQKLTDGMVHFHDSIKISNIPFPFPYAQTCDCLLVLHWMMTPIVVATSASQPVWSGIFSFFSVFILWALNAIAVEIENPFGMDANDIDTSAMQLELNKHLILLLDKKAQRTPFLAKDVRDSKTRRDDRRNSTFIDAWRALSMQGVGCNERIHRSCRPHRPRRNSTSSRDSRDSGTESIATQLEMLAADCGTASFVASTYATGTTSIGGFQPKLSDITIHSSVSIPEVSKEMFPGVHGEQDLNEPEWSMPDPGPDSDDHISCMPRRLDRDAREPDPSPSESNRSGGSHPDSSAGNSNAALANQVRPAREGPRASAATNKEQDRHKAQTDTECCPSKDDQFRKLERTGSPLSPMSPGQGLGGWAPAPCSYAPPSG